MNYKNNYEYKDNNEEVEDNFNNEIEMVYPPFENNLYNLLSCLQNEDISKLTQQIGNGHTYKSAFFEGESKEVKEKDFIDSIKDITSFSSGNYKYFYNYYTNKVTKTHLAADPAYFKNLHEQDHVTKKDIAAVEAAVRDTKTFEDTEDSLTDY